MRQPPRRLTTVASALVGGFITDAAFPQRSWWPLAIVGIALLVLSLRRDSARWAFVAGTAWGLAFFLPHIWWANDAVGMVPWLALSVAESLILGLGCVVFAWARRARWWNRHGARPVLSTALVFGLVWVVMEQCRQVFPFGGFPWGRLAFSQTEGPLLALASWGGAPLVSFAVVAAGTLLAALWCAVDARDMVRVPAAVLLVAAILIAPMTLRLDTRAQGGALEVGAVQGNVAEPGLGAFANAGEVLDNHADGTRDLLTEAEPGSLDLVVWPENSVDSDPRTNSATARTIDLAARAVEAPILLGTQRYTEETRYNEMVLWQPGEGVTFAYAKQIPAAFAEYIPIRDIARRFSSAVDLVTRDMSPGTEVGVVPVPVPRLDRTVTVGTAICFEVAYDALVRQSVRAGAEFLLVPTNNASFGYTAESQQQLAMSRLRAVEHGRTAIQISTVGVSGVIAPDGSVSEMTGLFTPDHFTTQVPLRSSLTVADRLGDWPMIIATALVALGLAAGIGTGRVARSRR